MSEPAVAAPVVLPPADQPPPPAAAPKPFAARYEAMASKLGEEPDEDPPEAASSTQSAPKPAAAAPAGDPKEAKRAQLKALAQELGLTVDETTISVQDAIEVRAAKRKNLEWKAAREAEFAKREQEFEATHGEKLKRSSAVLDAFERGDPESFAQALGVKDFNELQQSWIKRLADPNYMELRRLQKRAEEEDAKREAEAKTAEQRAQYENRLKVKQGYMQQLSEQCKNSTNPLVQAMHDDPMFLDAVYAVQEENWDGERTVTVEEAIKKAARGAKTDLETELRALKARLVKGLPDPVEQAAPPAATAKPNGKKPAPKTAVTPSNSGAAGGAPKLPSQMTPKEWAAYKAARFAESED